MLARPQSDSTAPDRQHRFVADAGHREGDLERAAIGPQWMPRPGNRSDEPGPAAA